MAIRTPHTHSRSLHSSNKENALMEPNVVIRVKLQLLGLTADEVADSLRVAGVKGKRVSTISCPVVTYLRRKLPGYAIYATQSVVDWAPIDSPPLSGIGETVMIPPPVRDFIKRFDLGDYPDLRQRVLPVSN